MLCMGKRSRQAGIRGPAPNPCHGGVRPPHSSGLPGAPTRRVTRPGKHKIQSRGVAGAAESAHAVLAGYDRPKLDKSVQALREHSKKTNVEIVEGRAKTRPRSKLWGTAKNGPMQETLLLSGTADDLRKVPHVQTEDGVYLQLLLE